MKGNQFKKQDFKFNRKKYYQKDSDEEEASDNDDENEQNVKEDLNQILSSPGNAFDLMMAAS